VDERTRGTETPQQGTTPTLNKADQDFASVPTHRLVRQAIVQNGRKRHFSTSGQIAGSCGLDLDRDGRADWQQAARAQDVGVARPDAAVRDGGPGQLRLSRYVRGGARPPRPPPAAPVGSARSAPIAAARRLRPGPPLDPGLCQPVNFGLSTGGWGRTNTPERAMFAHAGSAITALADSLCAP
jgi:hypothetical protein